jgi:hypothetical protein
LAIAFRAAPGEISIAALLRSNCKHPVRD